MEEGRKESRKGDKQHRTDTMTLMMAMTAMMKREGKGS